MKYYIAENGQQVGPIDEKELPSHGITINTLVWREGMTQWLPAGQVTELSYLFIHQQQMPPQPPYQQPYQQQQQQAYTVPPKTYLVEAILVTLFCCLPLGIVAIVKAANVNSLLSTGNIDAAKAASASAGKWVKWGFLIGLIASLLSFLFYILAFAGIMAL